MALTPSTVCGLTPIVYRLSHDGPRTMTTGYEHCILKMSRSFRMGGNWTLMRLHSHLKVHPISSLGVLLVFSQLHHPHTPASPVCCHPFSLASPSTSSACPSSCPILHMMYIFHDAVLHVEFILYVQQLYICTDDLSPFCVHQLVYVLV